MGSWSRWRMTRKSSELLSPPSLAVFSFSRFSSRLGSGSNTTGNSGGRQSSTASGKDAKQPTITNGVLWLAADARQLRHGGDC